MIPHHDQPEQPKQKTVKQQPLIDRGLTVMMEDEEDCASTFSSEGCIVSTPESGGADFGAGAATKAKKTVSFARNQTVHFVPAMRDLTAGQTTLIWYSPNDFRNFEDECRASIQQLAQDGVLDLAKEQEHGFNQQNHNNTCRGLECRTEEGSIRKRMILKQAMEAVIREQRLVFAASKSSTTNHATDSADHAPAVPDVNSDTKEERIAQAYQAVSRICCEQARERARQDHIYAQNYYAERSEHDRACLQAAVCAYNTNSMNHRKTLGATIRDLLTLSSSSYSSTCHGYRPNKTRETRKRENPSLRQALKVLVGSRSKDQRNRHSSLEDPARCAVHHTNPGSRRVITYTLKM